MPTSLQWRRFWQTGFGIDESPQWTIPQTHARTHAYAAFTYLVLAVGVTPERVTQWSGPGSAGAGLVWRYGPARPGNTLPREGWNSVPDNARTSPSPRCTGPVHTRGTRPPPPAWLCSAGKTTGVAACWSHCSAPVGAPCSPPLSQHRLWTAVQLCGAASMPAADARQPGPCSVRCSLGWAWSTAAQQRSAQRWGSHAAGWPYGGSLAPLREGPGCLHPATGSRSQRCGRSRVRRHPECQKGFLNFAGMLSAVHLWNTPSLLVACWAL